SETTTERVTTTQMTTTTRTVTKPSPPPDNLPPWAGITPCASQSTPACHAGGEASRELSGPVHDPQRSSGIRRVDVTLTRRVGRSCFAYIGPSFIGMLCRAAFRQWLRANVHGKRWSLVVGALAPGRYVVRASALDGAGNRQPRPARRVF